MSHPSVQSCDDVLASCSRLLPCNCPSVAAWTRGEGGEDVKTKGAKISARARPRCCRIMACTLQLGLSLCSRKVADSWIHAERKMAATEPKENNLDNVSIDDILGNPHLRHPVAPVIIQHTSDAGQDLACRVFHRRRGSCRGARRVA